MTGPAALSAYARANRLSQGELADRLGLSAGFVSLLLSRQRRPGIDVAARIQKRTAGAVPSDSWVGVRVRKPRTSRRSVRHEESIPHSK